MDRKIFEVEVLVNDKTFAHGLIDHGSSSYALVSADFAEQNALACFDIPAKAITGVAGPAGCIRQVCHFSLDVSGHRQAQVFAYVVPRAAYSIILGLPLVQDQKVLYLPEADRMWVKSTGVTVCRAAPKGQVQPMAHAASVEEMAALEVFAVSLADVEKALMFWYRTPLIHHVIHHLIIT